jgi:hypothetical protein
MIVSIMQPYFFPYIGYFQLIAQSDVFVILDDAQYIKGGWINRNRILRNGEPCWITLPVAHASHALPINQRSYQLTPKIRDRTRRQIESCYRKAPHFAKVFPLVREVLDCEDANVATYNENLITRVCERLQLRTRMVRSSELGARGSMIGQDRVIDLCKRLGATHYVNPIGGTVLYKSNEFAQQRLELSFLESTVTPYPQFGDAPVRSLSIIDVMMFNDDQRIATMLREFRLVR